MALTAAEYQIIQRAVHGANRVLNVQKDGNDANGGLAPSAADAFLTIAHAAAVATAGDVILVGPGVFNEGTNAINLPAQCKLKGAGEYLTTIQSTRLGGNGPAVLLGNNSEIEHLSIYCTAGTGVYQFCVGFDANSGHTPFTRAYARHCYFNGPYDVVVINANSATPAACTFILEDCHIAGGWDGIVTGNSNGAAWDNLRVELVNTTFDIDGTTGIGSDARCLVIRRGTIIVTACRLRSQGADDQLVYGILVEGSPSRVELYRTSILTAPGGGTSSAHDFENGSGGVMFVGAGTTFDRTKVTVGTVYTLIGPEGTNMGLIRGAGYLGNYKTGSIVKFDFPTTYTLGGTPAVRVYKESLTGETSTGVTLTVDYDARKGINHVEIDTSASGAFYVAGANYSVVLTTGSVDGLAVAPAVVGAFTLQKQHSDIDELLSGHTTAGTIGDYLNTLIQNVARLIYPSGTVYFISKAGNDGNDGKSWSTAKLTINSALSLVTAGDVIIVGPGTYAERVIATNTLIHIYAAGSVTVTGNATQSPVIQIGPGSTIDGIAIAAATNETTTQGIILAANSIVRGCQITATSSVGTARALAAFSPGCLVQDTIITVPASEKAVQAATDTIFDHCQFTGTLSGGIYSECSPSSVNSPGAYLVVGARNPSNSVGSSISLEMFYLEQKAFALTVTNNLGTPISLVGKTLRFVVETTASTPVGVFDVEQSGITLSGSSNEIANVVVPTTATAAIAAGTYEWRLWDVTTGGQEKVLLFGSLTILKAVLNVA